MSYRPNKYSARGSRGRGGGGGGGGGGSGRGAYYKARYGGGGGRGRGRGGSRGSIYDQNGGGIDDTFGYVDEGSRGIQGSIMELGDVLEGLEGNAYGGYKKILGGWLIEKGYEMWVDRVQGDSYAPPTRFRVRLELGKGGWPGELMSGEGRKGRVRWVAACDFLVRGFWREVVGKGLDVGKGVGGAWSGSKGGDVGVEKAGQCVLERSSCAVVEGKWLEVRFCVGLPARGRSIEGRRAKGVICEGLIQVLRRCLFWDRIDIEGLKRHVVCAEDQEYLRFVLLEKFGLVAFVANGSVLPRLSGAEDKPMNKEEVILFKAPKSMEVTLTLASGKDVTGMGIKKGITLICGGGFHGKSTLLSAIEEGVYNHIPGDGREYVSTNPNAMSIRAEDGRSVVGVDISPFIDNLPFGKKTDSFTSPDASGSTSQAANIVEALAAGAELLITDEDLAATNFMIRDEKMQRLVHVSKEPITPFLYRVRSLYKDNGVSTILVIGGAGDYFSVADTVIMMDSYVPLDVTEKAHAIASEFQGLHKNGMDENSEKLFQGVENRAIDSGSVTRVANSGRGKTRAQALRTIQFGDGELDLAAVKQIVEKGQTRALADAAATLAKIPEMKTSLTRAVQVLDQRIDSSGMDAVNSRGEKIGNYARPRKLEIAAAVNRIRGIKALHSKQ